MTVDICPTCGQSDPLPVLQRPAVPVFQNAVYRSRDEALRAPVGALDIVACVGCGFLWNRAFEPASVPYAANYENDQTYSPLFSAHVDAMAERVLAALSAAYLVVEVGCGQGYFLDRLVARAGSRLAAAIGFDPAWRGGGVPERVRVYPRRFDRDAVALLPGGPLIVVSRHVIEHVPDPVGFLKDIRNALSQGEIVALFLETPCVKWILSNQVLQDFFYEHCSYFTAESLVSALHQAGFGARAVDHVFGSQYLWLEAMPATSSAAIANGQAVVEIAQHFARTAKNLTDKLRARVLSRRQSGGVALWGAGAKGVTFANLIDPDGSLIDCLIDVNPRKQGAFVPLSGHPIVEPATAVSRGVRTAIIMNPNYADEIRHMCLQADLPFRLVTS